MTRAMKEILRKDADGDIYAASRIAQRAGYCVECYDGDGETGMRPPILYYSRKPKEEPDSNDQSF